MRSRLFRHLYRQLADDGYFLEFGVHYVKYARVLSDDVLLLSTHLLDLPEESIDLLLESLGVFGMKFSIVLVYYPSAIAPVGGAFDFWTPNKSGMSRTEALGKILAKLRLCDDAMVYFGRIHLGANDARMDRYPFSMTFLTSEFGGCVWMKPGTVMKCSFNSTLQSIKSPPIGELVFSVFQSLDVGVFSGI